MNSLMKRKYIGMEGAEKIIKTGKVDDLGRLNKKLQRGFSLRKRLMS